MNNFAYKNVVEVSCKRNSNTYPCGYAMRYVTSVNEYDSEVEVCSQVKIEGFERGWVGDLQFKADRINVCDCKEFEIDAIAHCIKDVVLKQIKINNEGKNCGTDFTYVFLKF